MTPTKRSATSDPNDPTGTSAASSLSSMDLTDEKALQADVDLKSFLEDLKQNHPDEIASIKLPRTPKLTNAQVDDIVKTFATNHKLTINQAKTFIAMFFQSGGSAKSCDGNMEITFCGKTIKLAALRATLKACKAKGAERKLARAMATEIYQISVIMKLPGNLSKRIIRENPTIKLSMEEQVWLSDFQSENLDCPELIRKLINETFSKRNELKSNAKNKKK